MIRRTQAPYRTRSVRPPPDQPQLGVFRFAPGRITDLSGPHVHDYLVFVYYDQGGGWHRVGALQRPAAAGDLYLIAPGEVHDSEQDDQASGWIVYFNAEALGEERLEFESFLWPGDPVLLPFVRPPGVQLGYVAVPPSERPRWEGRLSTLANELECHQLGYRDAAHALLRLLLIDAARLVMPVLGEQSCYHRPLLEGVFRFIDAHFAEPISLVDVARAIGRTPGYLTSRLRAATGRTVLEWITARRMIEARRLLTQTNDEIGRIAARVGYSDPTYFIRLFRRFHGMTPRQWRRAHR